MRPAQFKGDNGDTTSLSGASSGVRSGRQGRHRRTSRGNYRSTYKLSCGASDT